MRLGIIGWHTRTGLGTQNRDLAIHLKADRWIVPRHPRTATLPRPAGFGGEYVEIDFPLQRRTFPKKRVDLLADLDMLLFAEMPYFVDTLQHCRAVGTKSACYVNIEWLRRGGWGSDIYIAPTEYTHRRLLEDREIDHDRIFFAPIGVDTKEIPFQKRGIVQQYVHCNGTGGAYGRKGGEAVARAAELAPQVRLCVYTQTKYLTSAQVGKLPQWPSNATVYGEVPTYTDLYKYGQICVQPSRFEGIGLQLLECQAAGMPLITADCPPMNEYRPLEAVTGATGRISCTRWVHSMDVSVRRLASVLTKWWGKDVSAQSSAARQWVEAERDWSVRAAPLWDILDAELTRQR